MSPISELPDRERFFATGGERVYYDGQPAEILSKLGHGLFYYIKFTPKDESDPVYRKVFYFSLSKHRVMPED